MKVNGNGQGKVLTSDELRLLFASGFKSPRDRAVFAICLFTGCRISEALALKTTDIKGGMLTFRKSTTKTLPQIVRFCPEFYLLQSIAV